MGLVIKVNAENRVSLVYVLKKIVGQKKKKNQRKNKKNTRQRGTKDFMFNISAREVRIWDFFRIN